MNQSYVVISIGLIIFISYIFSKFFEKTKIPDVLPLFLIGIYLGPISGIISRVSINESAQIFAILTVTTILFASGLKINFKVLVQSFTKTTMLMLLNLVGTIFIVTVLAFFIFDIHPLLGSIVGILVGGISSAVVIPIVNQLKIKEETKTILTIESNLNVIFSVVVAFALWDIYHGNMISVNNIFKEIGLVMLLSILTGFVFGIIWSKLLGLARVFQNNLFTTPAFLLIIYGLADLYGANGTLSILIFGITLGNIPHLRKSEMPLLRHLGQFKITKNEQLFFSSLMFIFKTFFFVYMGIIIDVTNLGLMLWGFGVMILLYLWRIISVNIILKKVLPKFDLLVVKAMLPKGLVAGAVLVILGAPELEILAYPIIFMSIIGTSLSIFVIQLIKTDDNSADSQEPISEGISDMGEMEIQNLT